MKHTIYIFKKGSLLTPILLFILFTGCKKLVEVNAPITSINSANVFSVDGTAINAVTNIYSTITSQVGTNISSLSVYPGLSADELTLYSGQVNASTIAYYQNALNAALASGNDFFWIDFYNDIYQANASIVGLKASNSLTPEIKQDLLGESYFMRAFCFFYLTNLYGNVPMPLTTDYKMNGLLSRTTQAQVYQQIISDLHNAQKLLRKTYLDATVLSQSPERVRPNYWAATALLARTDLYYAELSTGNTSYFAKADSASTALISNNGTFSLSTLNNAFLRASMGNNEVIWQLQPTGSVGGSGNTPDGFFFILPSSGPNTSNSNWAYLSPFLVNAFESGDQRLAAWVGSVTVGGTTYYYPFKYKVNDPSAPTTEYEMVFRLGEQYLIRAEAEAQSNDLADAAADLNVIRNRAGLPNTTAATQPALLTAILHERQVELFTEWGHRWLDLKRSGTINAVMGSPGGVCAAKGGAWNPDWALYPIPLSEIKADPNLTQNAGY